MNSAQRISPLHPSKGAFLLAVILVLLAGGRAVGAGTDPTDPKPPKPSSLAPHPTSKRSFGTPIQAQILHKRRKPAAPAQKGAGIQATTPQPARTGEAPK